VAALNLETSAVSAIILAAGTGRRMGGTNKLLSDLAGRPLVHWSVAAALQSQARPVIVVLGHDATAVAAALAGLPVTCVNNPRFAEGISTSLTAGIGCVPASATGAAVLLADMPRVQAAHIDRLIAALAPVAGRSVIVPTHRGRRGNPVVWAAACLPALCTLRGDFGGRALFADLQPLIHEVEIDDPGVLIDVDDQASLQRLKVGRA
jgi:molybdenum cofactor cytidylyltransferase